MANRKTRISHRSIKWTAPIITTIKMTEKATFTLCFQQPAAPISEVIPSSGVGASRVRVGGCLPRGYRQGAVVAPASQ